MGSRAAENSEEGEVEVKSKEGGESRELAGPA